MDVGDAEPRGPWPPGEPGVIESDATGAQTDVNAAADPEANGRSQNADVVVL
jgi:hypothetical protein